MKAIFNYGKYFNYYIYLVRDDDTLTYSRYSVQDNKWYVNRHLKFSHVPKLGSDIFVRIPYVGVFL